ncbi:MAG: SMI1/KNR4 family protein [Bacteroidota bacterium]
MKAILFNAALKKLKASELEFQELSTSAINTLRYKDGRSKHIDSFGFMDMLAETFEQQLSQKIEKMMFFMTPELPQIDNLGFLFLQNRTILPIKINQGKNYTQWYSKITKLDTGNELKYENSLLSQERRSGGISASFFPGFGPPLESFADHVFFQDIGIKLYNKAPNSFKTEELIAEKEAYLRPFVIGKSAYKLSIYELEEVISQLPDLNPPLSDIEVYEKDFWEKTGLSLPAELRALLSIADGNTSFLDNNYRLLSAREILNEWASWKSIFEDWTLEDLKVHISDGEKSLPMYTTPYWIPFMSDGTGNFKAIDLAPGPKGRAGQIISFGADEDLIKVLAEDLVSYLQRISK